MIPARRGRLGSTAKAVLGQAQYLALIVQQGTHLRPLIIVVYYGLAFTGRALTAGAFVAGVMDNGLTVLPMVDDLSAAWALEQEVAGWLAERGLTARYRQLSTDRAPRLARWFAWREAAPWCCRPKERSCATRDCWRYLMRLRARCCWSAERPQRPWLGL